MVCFALEALAKIIGLGVSSYFRYEQNQFDFCLVIVSFFGMFQQLLPLNVTLLRVIRGFRILRVFKSLRELGELIITLKKSVNNFISVIIVSFMLIFIYSLIG